MEDTLKTTNPYFHMLLHAAFALAKDGSHPASANILFIANDYLQDEKFPLRIRYNMWHDWNRCLQDCKQFKPNPNIQERT